MTFPVPSAKLFTTETSAIGGKVDNNAKAVVNLTITPSKEKFDKKKLRVEEDNIPKVYTSAFEEKLIQVQYQVEEEIVPKVYAADDEDEENPYTEIKTETK